MPKPAGIVLTVIDWGTSETEAPSYSVSMSSSRQNEEGQVVPTQTPVLVHGRTIIEGFVENAFARRRIARVDAPRGQPPGTWPRWALGSGHFRTLLDSLSLLGDEAYPLTTWLIHEPSAGEEDHLVDASMNEPHDPDLYVAILEAGVIRVAIDGPYCDIVSRVDIGPQLLEWMRSAVAAHPSTAIEWISLAD